MYLIRLDDASEYMDVDKWQKVLSILDAYNVCPIIGIIPKCEDKDFTSKYQKNNEFWSLARMWQKKNYIIAMHGYKHVFHYARGGYVPIHNRSEFVGVSLKNQKEKIRSAYSIFKCQNINPKIFFAPAHSFDNNTLRALKAECPIRIISDTIANNVYKKDKFFFLPCQMGRPRSLPLKFVTIALHPNNLTMKDFIHLKLFLKKNSEKCVKNIKDIKLISSPPSLLDIILQKIYLYVRKIKKVTRHNI